MRTGARVVTAVLILGGLLVALILVAREPPAAPADRKAASPGVFQTPREHALQETAAAPSESPPEPRASIHVRVIGPRAEPVGGATVEVFRGVAPTTEPTSAEPESVAVAQSGAAGIAKLAGVPPDAALHLTAQAPGLGRAVLAVRSPFVGHTLEVDVVLGSACALRGRTVGPSGEPIADAVVQIGTGWAWRTTSDADGAFVLAGLPFGAHDVRAGRERMTPKSIGEVVLPLAGELTIGLEPAATLTGVVIDAETGTPLEGVEVTAGIWWGMQGGGAARTDDTGTYVIDTLPTGTVNQVTARLPGYVLPRTGRGMRATQIGVVAGRTARHDLALSPTRDSDGSLSDARVHGVVTGPEGPVSEATVTLQGKGGRRSARTDEAGAYEFDAVEPGDWIVFVLRGPDGLRDPAYAQGTSERDWSACEVTVEPAGAQRHDVTLVRGPAIVGRVVDADGAPIPGARFANAATDSEGRFRLTGLAPGERIDAYVEAPGFVRIIFGADAPAEGESDEIVATLTRFAAVRGTVTAADGELPHDVRIRVVARTGRMIPGPSRRPDLRASADVTADAAGRYAAELRWTESGEFVVAVSAAGHPTTTSDPVRIEAGRAEYAVDVSLAEGVTVAGQVVDDATGAPVVGAQITLGNTVAVRVAAITDEGGRFAARAAAGPAPRIGVRAGAAGYTDAYTTVDARDPADVVVRMTPERVISGRVVTEDGAPLAGVRVTAGTPQGTSCVSGHDGGFELRGLHDEPYPLHIAPANAAGPSIRREVVPDVAPGTRDVVIVAHAGYRISGRVTLPDGATVADAIVRAVPPGERAGISSPWARTHGDGRFTIVGLAAGAHDVTATPSTASPYAGESAGSFPATARGVAAGTDGLELVLRTGYSIGGVVVDAHGRPLPSVGLEAGGRTARTEHDGTFTLEGLAPGRFRIRPVPSSEPGAPVAFVGGEDVPAGATDVRLEAVPGTPLTGSVVDDAGRPVEGARVELRAAPRTRREVRTDASGTFRFESAPRGALSLTARAEGLVPARVTIEADGAAPRLTLGRGLVSTGAIVDADGAPVAGRWLDFVIEGEDHLRREARTDEEGRFRVDGLADREYRVIALVRRDGDVARVPAGAIRGGAVDVALRLE